MNLHIVPDNTFINRFYENLKEANLLDQNKIIVRTNNFNLKSINHPLPYASLYSSQFDSLVGDTFRYKKVFIHYFTPLLYRWIAVNEFQDVNWMVWGGDIYNLPSIDHLCYEPMTLRKYVEKDWSLESTLYQLKILFTNTTFKNRAYGKVTSILTWMHSEYEFVRKHLPVQASHKFFFYENQLPYNTMDGIVSVRQPEAQRVSLIIGNSGSPANNHLDIVQFLEDNGVSADLLIPVSYGDSRYVRFLKRNLHYSYGKIEFIEHYMSFHEYLNFLSSADALVMNTIRPQGYGNIFMMLYMNKPVFLNRKNISLPDLDRYGINWLPIENLVSFSPDSTREINKKVVLDLLSHELMMESFHELFS